MIEKCNCKVNNCGYTLIEVLIAIAIFSIGLMAMGALQSSALIQTGDVARKTEAWAILDQQAERLKGLQFYTNVSTQTFHADLTAGSHSEASQDGRYDILWTVVDDNPIGKQDETVVPGVSVGNYTVCKTITVAVARSGKGMDEAIAMVEFVKTWAAEPGGMGA
jgi:prepilin-type N-terminal cleavage/methylation domain-containing protein